MALIEDLPGGWHHTTFDDQEEPGGGGVATPSVSGASSPSNPYSGYAVPRGTKTNPGTFTDPGFRTNTGTSQSPGLQRPTGTPDQPVVPPPAAPPTAPTGGTPYSLSAFRQAFDKATAGRPGTVEDFISNVFPELQRQFPGIQRFGSKGEKIRLPDGTVIDAVLSAGVGGRGYAFQIDNGAGSFFQDPIGEWYGSLIQSVIDKLSQPATLDPHVDESYNILKQLSTGGGAYAPSGPMDLSELANLTRQRVAQLNAEPFSQGEEAAQRVKAFDNLERSRAVAINQVRERLVAQGHAPTSGTVEAAIQQVNQQFDGLRAQNENSLLLNNIDERQRRRSEAVSIEQQLADRQLSAQGIAEQARSSAGSRSLSAAQALAQLAQYISNFMDPGSRLAQLVTTGGLIPTYAQQQFRNTQGTLEQ